MKFKIVNIFTAGMGLSIMYCGWRSGPHWLYLLLVLAFVHSIIVFFGCVNISWSFFLPVTCAAKTKIRAIALTFDDGPDHATTPGILDVLKKYNVNASFFCIGKHIPGNEDLLLRIVTEGHIVGNHSYSHHFWFDMFSSKKMLVDMREMDRQVLTVTGKQPAYFRPPYGVTNPNLKRAILKAGYSPIGWNIRSFDTVATDKMQLLDRVASKLKPGAIILLHDTKEITAEILPSLIELIIEKGYSILPLAEMTGLPAYK